MVPEKKAKPLRIVGKTIDKDVDIFTGLQSIDGLRPNRIERILTQAGLYTYKMKDTRKDKKKGAKPETTKRSFEKVYPNQGRYGWRIPDTIQNCQKKLVCLCSCHISEWGEDNTGPL